MHDGLAFDGPKAHSDVSILIALDDHVNQSGGSHRYHAKLRIDMPVHTKALPTGAQSVSATAVIGTRCIAGFLAVCLTKAS
jgi:hypothetical protein